MSSSKNFKSILSNMEKCYWCGSTREIEGSLDKHHIFGGGNRNKSEEDGCYVYLCRNCHRFITDHPKTSLVLKKQCEQAWINQGKGTEEDFIRRYGKSYLWNQ